MLKDVMKHKVNVTKNTHTFEYVKKKFVCYRFWFVVFKNTFQKVQTKKNYGIELHTFPQAYKLGCYIVVSKQDIRSQSEYICFHINCILIELAVLS